MTPQRPGNPARALEKFAVETVSAWVGPRGTVVDNSAGHLPDFSIDYFDGRTAVGEVGWHQDPKLAAMWGDARRSATPQFIELPSGYGKWGVTLRLGARTRNLDRDLPPVILLLRNSGIDTIEVDEWQPGQVVDALRAAGVDHAFLADSDEPSHVVFFMPAGGGAARDDPNQIAEWFNMVLNDPNYADTTEKLLAVQADERHVFLGMGGLTPYAMEHNLRIFSSSSLPTQTPNAPASITHIWGVGEYGGEAVALWSAASGWSAVPLPSPT